MSGNIFYDILLQFGAEMGVAQSMLDAVAYIEGAMLLLAIAGCFMGLRLFRFWNAVVAFFLTALAVNALLRDVASIGTIVTVFALLGLVAAFLAYRYIRIGAFALVALIFFGIARAYVANTWVAAALALLPATLTIPFLGHIIVYATSIWGAFTLVRQGAPLLGISLSPAAYIAIGVLLAAGGIVVQYVTNEQSEFLEIDQKYRIRRKKAKKQTAFVFRATASAPGEPSAQSADDLPPEPQAAVQANDQPAASAEAEVPAERGG